MSDTILFVDDSPVVLETAKDLFLAQGIKILTADNAMAAIEIIRHQDIAVVVSDNFMPGISGIEFLTKLTEISPETVKVLMTAHADLSSALEAINRSEVFRFILKPWNSEEMLSIVDEGIQRHRVLQSLKKEEEDVFRSLALAIELKDPSTRGHCDRVAVFALLIADMMQLPEEIKREIKYGSWLHDWGKIGISETILNGNQRLSDTELATMKMHVNWGADLAAKANLSPVARNIIQYHHECYDGTGYPYGIHGNNIPIEARIVAVADVYDALITDRSYRTRYSPEEAVAILRSMQGNALDPEVVDLFLSAIATTPLPKGIADAGKVSNAGTHRPG
ncbi:MAG TPA: HD domain-containing phosphohydrolase [Geobacteraceae bacterium]|nr:HD domain-containing phosphohydrolase [Geobacteraceae bacterium]